LPATTEPQGTVTDWKNGVDDGALLVVSVAASPAIANLASSQTVNISWGEGTTGAFIGGMLRPDGSLSNLNGGLVYDTTILGPMGIPEVGSTLPNSNLTVLQSMFYKPPVEFNQNSPSDPSLYRRIPLAVELDIDGKPAAEGGKPEGVLLMRPPLVLVHGINSGPDAWSRTSGSNPSFIQRASEDGYPTTFIVDHRGPDPVTGGPDTQGEGELTHMYLDVMNEISVATASYRSGLFQPVDPYSPSASGVAVQKVDVVAHSYGGLLTRWYVEQSPQFATRRDVRTLIELDTPNLGSPLANLVTQAYEQSALGEMISSAQANGVLGTIHPVIGDLLKSINVPGELVTSVPNSGVANPFFFDDGVDSPLLAQLNATPFNPDVGYASTIGTSNTFGWLVDPFKAFQPIGSTGQSYFPWIYTFNSAVGATDGIVPSWSQALGIPAYSVPFPDNHSNIIADPAVQQQVMQWLSDPNVPLGSAQRSAWMTNNQNLPPVSQRNAYLPAVIQNGTYSGGGLNPTALDMINFSGAGYQGLTWDGTNAGIHVPTITGMIQYGDIGNATYAIQDKHGTVLLNLGKPTAVGSGVGKYNIDQAQYPNAKLSDLVAFSYTPAVGGLGRRQEQKLTGPNGDSDESPFNWVSYTITGATGQTSGPTYISLPYIALPKMTHNLLTVTGTGAAEAQNVAAPNQTNHVQVWTDNLPFGRGTELTDISVLIAHPAGTWNGVLLPYTFTYMFTTDPNGFVIGNLGNSQEQRPSVYQYLIEANTSDVENLSSPDIDI
jgi:pimeloyl-ACP methyl ester carboxylesterase